MRTGRVCSIWPIPLLPFSFPSPRRTAAAHWAGRGMNAQLPLCLAPVGGYGISPAEKALGNSQESPRSLSPKLYSRQGQQRCLGFLSFTEQKLCLKHGRRKISGPQLPSPHLRALLSKRGVQRRGTWSWPSSRAGLQRDFTQRKRKPLKQMAPRLPPPHPKWTNFIWNKAWWSSNSTACLKIMEIVTVTK